MLSLSDLRHLVWSSLPFFLCFQWISSDSQLCSCLPCQPLTHNHTYAPPKHTLTHSQAHSPTQHPHNPLASHHTHTPHPTHTPTPTHPHCHVLILLPFWVLLQLFAWIHSSENKLHNCLHHTCSTHSIAMGFMVHTPQPGRQWWQKEIITEQLPCRQTEMGSGSPKDPVSDMSLHWWGPRLPVTWTKVKDASHL